MGGQPLKKIAIIVRSARIWADTKAQDLIEYALMAGFVAVAAGAIMPGVASKISVIFSKVSSSLTAAGS
jgi:Flp pilus assembly pilin Flp